MLVAQDPADAVGIRLVPVRAEQDAAEVGVFLDEDIQIAQIREGGAAGLLGVVGAADLDQALRHLLFELAEQIIDVPVVDVERAAVDVGDRGELTHGNVLYVFLTHQLHQRKPQLAFCFSYAAVNGFFVHETASFSVLF